MNAYQIIFFAMYGGAALILLVGALAYRIFRNKRRAARN